jgi:cation:H+ antiporter
MLDLAAWPLWVNLLVFAVAAAFVWGAGTPLARDADELSEATGMGRAMVGAVVMAGITSLPELATVITAAVGGSAPLAVNNILGGVAMQVAVLAVGDFVLRQRALSSIVPDPGVMLQGALGIVMLAATAAGILVGDHTVLGVGIWSYVILLIYILAMWMMAGERTSHAWRPTREDRLPHRDDEQHPVRPLWMVILRLVATGGIILVAGFVLTRTSEGLAEQTDLGESFVGVVLLAIATSLPEVSSVIAAVRNQRYEMAYGDILGTNLFDIVLIAIADIFYVGPAILGEVGTFSAFGALLGIAVTAIALVGLLERRDTTVARMGVDSIGIIVVYVSGLVVLYHLR